MNKQLTSSISTQDKKKRRVKVKERRETQGRRRRRHGFSIVLVHTCEGSRVFMRIAGLRVASPNYRPEVDDGDFELIDFVDVDNL